MKSTRGESGGASGAKTTVQKWPLDQQAAFLFDAWDHLVEQGWMPQPSGELCAELDRRIAAHDADPGNVFTWEEVLAHARKKPSLEGYS